MDIPKFKDIIQKLSVFKSYSSLLVPVIIGVVGVLVFIPTGLMSSSLRKHITDESVSMGKKVQSLSKSAVARDQWKVEQEYQQAYERDANQIMLLGRQSTQRQLLSYKIFPEPKDTSTLIFSEFGRQFRMAVEQLISGLNGRDCPTSAELERTLQSPALSRGGGGIRMSYGGFKDEINATIVDVLCREKAESASVYVNPLDLSGYEFWKKYEYIGRKEAIGDCWYWQLGYWIIEDVVDTIAACNSSSNSVFTSPVKRLLSVNFTASDKTLGMSRAKVGKPHYVLSIADALTEPCTGRFTNDDIDVMHFNIAVEVGTKAVLPFMQQLCSAKQYKFRGFSGEKPEKLLKHNQITILESEISPINREDNTHHLYRYGEDAVVRLDLTCEYIFNKKGYDEVKPESVKEFLKKPEE